MPANEKHLENWNTLYVISAVAAWIVVLFIPIQVAVFMVFPPPESPVDFFILFNKNPLLGLLSLDLLYIIDNTLMILFYLGLFATLRNTNLMLTMIATVLGLIGISAYYASAVAFDMLSISKLYQLADTAELKQQLVAVGHGLLATYKGTSFNVYYVLNAITLLMFSTVMIQGHTFSRTTAYWGLASGILMIIPSTAGKIGLIFSLLSLIPWMFFSILAAKKLFILGKK